MGELTLNVFIIFLFGAPLLLPLLRLVLRQSNSSIVVLILIITLEILILEDVFLILDQKHIVLFVSSNLV